MDSVPPPDYHFTHSCTGQDTHHDTPPLALSQAEQRRLEKLAEEAGRTPKAMLKHVLRDGFDYTEEFVRKVKEGLAELDAGKGVPRAARG